MNNDSGFAIEELKVDLPADRHPVAVYLASLSKGSLAAQRSALRKIASIFGRDIQSMNWGALRYPHLQLIRTYLTEHYSAVTANRFLTALRRVLPPGYTGSPATFVKGWSGAKPPRVIWLQYQNQ